MGAEIFQNYSDGKDAATAYKKAVEMALYYHGHGGYSGTIAEKGGYVRFECPSGIKATQLMNWAEHCSYKIEYLKDVPEKHRQLVANMAVVFDDKWGPAVCIELRGKELADEREKYCEEHHVKRTSRKFFLFGGYASS